jgi:hypothetical protein
MRQTHIIKFKDGVPEECCWPAWHLLIDYLEEKGAGILKDELPKMSRVWTEIVTTEAGSKCTGFATIVQVWDVNNFHCDDDRTRARLMQRISTVLEESVGGRAVALVFINPETEKDWIPMLEIMGAQRANRWLVPTSLPLEKGGENVFRADCTAKQSSKHT